ncbi:hypothetical protein DFJ74DRAFT_304338 [Hyaloraphidium curvatum]|nr:hypothetical protein DFJ74DRAFT_304338 [Hyaloraphidium curvatum]
MVACTRKTNSKPERVKHYGTSSLYQWSALVCGKLTSNTNPMSTMSRPLLLLLVTFAALLALAGATPVRGGDGGPSHILFARSCSECGQDTFCEFGHPGASEDQVACIGQKDTDYHSLYRRYAPEYIDCGTFAPCSGAPAYVTPVSSDAEAAAMCTSMGSSCAAYAVVGTDMYQLNTVGTTGRTTGGTLFNWYVKYGLTCPTLSATCPT